VSIASRNDSRPLCMDEIDLHSSLDMIDSGVDRGSYRGQANGGRAIQVHIGHGPRFGVVRKTKSMTKRKT
jgi:hypothetical protein